MAVSNEGSITVTVLLFAHLVESGGEEQSVLELPTGSSAADVLDRLAANHEAVAALRPVLAIAVNERYANPDHLLCDGDTIALIPPVSGG